MGTKEELAHVQASLSPCSSWGMLKEVRGWHTFKRPHSMHPMLEKPKGGEGWFKPPCLHAAHVGVGREARGDEGVVCIHAAHLLYLPKKGQQTMGGQNNKVMVCSCPCETKMYGSVASFDVAYCIVVHKHKVVNMCAEWQVMLSCKLDMFFDLSQRCVFG